MAARDFRIVRDTVKVKGPDDITRYTSADLKNLGDYDAVVFHDGTFGIAALSEIAGETSGLTKSQILTLFKTTLGVKRVETASTQSNLLAARTGDYPADVIVCISDITDISAAQRVDDTSGTQPVS